MDPATITLAIGIISCVIGVSTFVTGRMAKAEHNGSMETKINQALEGISSINSKLEGFARDQRETDLLVRSNEEKLRTLFDRVNELREDVSAASQTHEILKDLVHTLQRIEERHEKP